MSAGGVAKTTVDDRVWRQLRKRLPGIAKMRVKVGLVGPAAGAAHEDSDISIAEIGAIHEFGAPDVGIPERSFLRKTFVDRIEDLKHQQVVLARAMLDGKMTPDRAFRVLGLWGASAVKATITEGRVSPRLEESAAGLRTIARKGSSQTLVDTGQLLNSITWIKDEKG